jgi:hypothetical protein
MHAAIHGMLHSILVNYAFGMLVVPQIQWCYICATCWGHI